MTVDLTANARWRTSGLGDCNLSLNATYVNTYEYQREPGGAFVQNVGMYTDTGPVFRWQYTLAGSWSQGPWSLGLVEHYKDGYLDQVPSHHVGSWSVWDLYGTWQPVKAVSLTVGVRNLLDTAPPESNQCATFQVGYDPRFADATGRIYYLRGSYP